jgi:NAD(P)-dependent dehydrogenase (short-subunit alcohol dehydrogenase family)
MTETDTPVLLLVGAADGFGASLAGAFAGAGHDVVGITRGEHAAAALARATQAHGRRYAHFTCDLAQPQSVEETVRTHAGAATTVVYNAAALVMKPFAETTPGEFEHAWRIGCLGAYAAARAVLPARSARGAGTLIFTGATASRRGGANFAAFASAKFALRGLAQALSREYGRAGVHVAHVVLDGLIDAAQSERRFGKSAGVRIDPDAAAQAYLALARQPRSAWTHELDLRPFAERF